MCYPRCDTQPDKAGDIETLTQRYWEAMLSRIVIVGRAPKELTDLIGYNPVIEIGKDNQQNRIIEILDNIDNYQSIVDKNRRTAIDLGGWDLRIKEIQLFLQNNGYKI